jgi:hypothetical protein
MSGWIKLHRSIQEHWLYTEKRKFSRFEAWNDILLTVNYSDAQSIIKGKVYNIKRGQSILSLDSWAKRWNWDKNAVRRFFSLLQKEQMIFLVSDNITTQLTVCKYEDYQDERNANETQKKRKRNANDIQTTPIKEEEENKEEKEVLLKEWIAYRKEIKKQLSEATINKLKEEMNSYTDEKCSYVINTSIKNGWQGLFWDKYIEKSEAPKQINIDENNTDYTEVNEMLKKRQAELMNQFRTQG